MQAHATRDAGQNTVFPVAVHPNADRRLTTEGNGMRTARLDQRSGEKSGHVVTAPCCAVSLQPGAVAFGG